MELALQLIQENEVTIIFMLYVLFFGSLARAALHHTMGKHAGRIGLAFGLTMASALLLAQRHLEFELSRLGTLGILLILLTTAVVAYRVLVWNEIHPIPSSLAAGLLFLIGLQSALPEWEITLQPWYGRSLGVGIILCTLGLLSQAGHNKNPNFLRGLQQVGLLPNPINLKGEENRLKGNTPKRIGKIEEKANRDLKRARHELRQGKNALNKAKLLKDIQMVEEEANTALQALLQLQRLDRALTQLDSKRLMRLYNINLNDYTPEQKRKLKEALHQERARLNLEKELQHLGFATEHAIVLLRENLEKATNLIKGGNMPAAQGWLDKAEETLQHTRQSTRQLQTLHTQVLRSLKEQVRALH